MKDKITLLILPVSLILLFNIIGCVTLEVGKRCVLIGKVVDAKTGDGVDSINIKVIDIKNNSEIVTMHTTSRGEFTISKLKKGEYKLCCYKEDVVEPREKIVDLKKLSKEEMRSLTIPVILFSALEGKVISAESDEPISLATIRFVDEDNSEISKTWSEPDGKFIFRNIAVNKGKFRIEHPSFIWIETTSIDLEPGKKLILEDIKLTLLPEPDWVNPTGEYEIIKIKPSESGIITSY